MKKKLKPEQIFFIDISKVKLGSFTRDSIRLDQEKKIWGKETYELRNQQQKNFEKLIWTWEANIFLGRRVINFPTVKVYYFTKMILMKSKE